MATEKNLTQTTPKSNSPACVRLINTCRTTWTGTILPAGSTGRIIDYDNGNMVIDFGLDYGRVIILPADTDLVRASRLPEEVDRD